MKKGLFTTMEEIKFQNDYVQGYVEPLRDPNLKRSIKELRVNHKGKLHKSKIQYAHLKTRCQGR